MAGMVDDLEALLRTLAQIYAMQGKREEVEVLARSRSRLEQVRFDNWDGGTYFYALHLSAPLLLFAQTEKRIAEMQKDFQLRIQPLLHAYANEHLEDVIISVEVENDANWRSNAIRWLDQKADKAVRQPSECFLYDAFISHASEDKQALVRPLAEALRKRRYRVWYDEFELTLGDSLRQKIDYGLSKSKYGIIVLSPAFFAKKWPAYELDGLLARQTIGAKVVLPIWHNITRDDILRFSPPLADRLAVESGTMSIPQIVGEIIQVLASPVPEAEQQE